MHKDACTLLPRQQAGPELQEARALLLRMLDEQPVTRALPAEAAAVCPHRQQLAGPYLAHKVHPEGIALNFLVPSFSLSPYHWYLLA